MLQTCSIIGKKRRFDFADEAPLLSLPDFIPHPHSSSYPFASQVIFFFPSPPKKGKSFSLVCRAAEVQTAHFSFSEVWKWNIHDYRELSLSRGDEDGEGNSCHFDMGFHPNFRSVRALFQDSCTPLIPVGSLWTWRTEGDKMAHLFLTLFQAVFFAISLLLLFSTVLSLLHRLSHQLCDISTAARKKRQTEGEFVALLHYGEIMPTF